MNADLRVVGIGGLHHGGQRNSNEVGVFWFWPPGALELPTVLALHPMARRLGDLNEALQSVCTMASQKIVDAVLVAVELTRELDEKRFGIAGAVVTAKPGG